jgi:hypothetical protein
MNNGAVLSTATRPKVPSGAGSSVLSHRIWTLCPGSTVPIEPGLIGAITSGCQPLVITIPSSVCPYWSRIGVPNVVSAHGTRSGVRGSPALEAQRSRKPSGTEVLRSAR